jgi:hypothetical protein
MRKPPYTCNYLHNAFSSASNLKGATRVERNKRDLKALIVGGGALAMLLACSGCGTSDPAKTAEDRRLGEHCVVGGFSSEFVAKVKEQLRDPNSFEHIETRIGPVDATGQHTIGMRYRSRNGFGGMNEQTAIGTVSNATCAATVTIIG